MFKIIIERIEKRTMKVNEWNRLHDKEEFDTEKEPQYGYVERIKEVEEKTQLYEQTSSADTIDIMGVIKAFNKPQ